MVTLPKAKLRAASVRRSDEVKFETTATDFLAMIKKAILAIKISELDAADKARFAGQRL